MELGIEPSMPRAWRGRPSLAAESASAPAHAGDATPAPSPEQAEIRRLPKALDRAQMERDLLKKAIGIFSGPPG
jgi:transposase